MSDFEQDFMKQVNVPDVSMANGDGAKEKKPIDKRWFVLGGGILVLVIVLVVLLIIDNQGGTTDGDTATDDSTTSSYRGRLQGGWKCDEGTTMDYYGDGTYTWANYSGDNGWVESGDFSEENGKLSLKRTSLYEESVGVITESGNGAAYYEIEFEDATTVNIVGIEKNYLCESSK